MSSTALQIVSVKRKTLLAVLLIGAVMHWHGLLTNNLNLNTMTKREHLEAKRKSNFDKIEDLKKQNIELAKELCLLSDEKQWFTEKEEEHVISKRPKKTEPLLVGRIHWNEFFKDGDYPDDESKGVWIERSQVVRVNGEWR